MYTIKNCHTKEWRTMNEIDMCLSFVLLYDKNTKKDGIAWTFVIRRHEQPTIEGNKKNWKKKHTRRKSL